jgi:hypothetical protein
VSRRNLFHGYDWLVKISIEIYVYVGFWRLAVAGLRGS